MGLVGPSSICHATVVNKWPVNIELCIPVEVVFFVTMAIECSNFSKCLTVMPLIFAAYGFANSCKTLCRKNKGRNGQTISC